MKPDYYQIFKKGSKTYYYSSLFFPKELRDQIAVLYAFVRILDNLIDSTPQQNEAFYEYWSLFEKRWDSGNCGVEFIDEFVSLVKIKDIKKEWIDAFWKSMEMDLVKPVHKNLKETEDYMYGSAEVIGLMMARVLDLPKESYEAAKKLGKAMQYANFIRDFVEDRRMGRNYLQAEGREDFLANFELYKQRYDGWQKEAEEGYKFIPKRYLIPVKTAAEMYKWTVERIARNPEVVFETKVKPSKLRIVGEGLVVSLGK